MRQHAPDNRLAHAAVLELQRGRNVVAGTFFETASASGPMAADDTLDVAHVHARISRPRPSAPGRDPRVLGAAARGMARGDGGLQPLMQAPTLAEQLGIERVDLLHRKALLHGLNEGED